MLPVEPGEDSGSSGDDSRAPSRDRAVDLGVAWAGRWDSRDTAVGRGVARVGDVRLVATEDCRECAGRDDDAVELELDEDASCGFFFGDAAPSAADPARLVNSCTPPGLTITPRPGGQLK